MRGNTARLGKESRSAPPVASPQGKGGIIPPCLASTPSEGLSRPSALHDEAASCSCDPGQSRAD